MVPEQAQLSMFPSEGNVSIPRGRQQSAPLRIEDALAGFATERTGALAVGYGRSPSDESLTRLRMAVAGFQWEMSQLKTQRAIGVKEPAPPPAMLNLWRRILRFGLFAGGLLVTAAAAAAHLVGFVTADAEALAALRLSKVKDLEAASIARPLAALASRPIAAARPTAAAALRPPALAPIAPARRASVRAAGPRAAANGRAASPAPHRFTGSLIVNSEPQGGTVFINQSRVGVTPLRLDDYPAGSYALWIQHEGYQRWTASVMVPANRVTRVTPKLVAAARR